jgi:hypothetical protein
MIRAPHKIRAAQQSSGEPGAIQCPTSRTAGPLNQRWKVRMLAGWEH